MVFYVLWFSFVVACLVAFPHSIPLMLYSLNIDYRRNSLLEYKRVDVRRPLRRGHLGPNKLPYRPINRSWTDLDHPNLRNFLFHFEYYSENENHGKHFNLL